MRPCRSTAYRLKNISAYVGLAGYVSMLITGNVLIGATTKLIAEALRISYFLETDAKDMARLSVFFMVASSILIISNLL